jgi:hypothetical protein
MGGSLLTDVFDSLLVGFKYLTGDYNPFFAVWCFIVLAYLVHFVNELMRGDFGG